MKVISLIENTCVNKDLECEHGLSLYIELNNKKILFDTGASSKFISNATKCGVDLKDIDYVIISHGHFDHGGGLINFLNINNKAKVIIKEDANKDYYGQFLFIKLYIGLNKEIFTKYKDRLIIIKNDCELTENVHIISDINNQKYSVHSANMKEMIDGKLVPDQLKHEIMLVIEEDNELTVFSGCSHNGILNMIDTVNQKFPNNKIKTVIGGFHFIGTPIINNFKITKKYLRQVACDIKHYQIEKIYTCHCTGKRAYKILKDQLKDQLDYLSTGEKINI